MSSDLSYSTTFILDKPYFTECFEQSVKLDYSWQAYFKAIFFTLFGAILVLFTPINAYVAWFLFGLGIVEALSVYYQKPWWVTRQMLSRAAKSEVTLTINDEGIDSRSFYNEQTIYWQDISIIKNTNKGWLIIHAKGKNYISFAFLNDEANKYLQQKSDTLQEHVESENV